MHTRFTEHAFGRVDERLHLSHEEVAQLLDNDTCVPLGKDGPSNRGHKLFYSEPDSFWFVAVQDEATGEVITVLPVDYHNRWKVSGDALSLARAKVRGEEISLPLPLPVQIEPALELEPKMVTLRFMGTVINKRCKTRVVGLGRMRYELEQLHLVNHDPAVREFLKDQIERAPLLEGESFEEFFAYSGKRSNKKYMSLELKTLP
ncbi:hypothetical protein HYT05_01270 [Candidatus Kaiserbacteria bacterium]|nr:hypothetical protein [Candidatus Kaiserbacteria bacterium]